VRDLGLRARRALRALFDARRIRVAGDLVCRVRRLVRSWVALSMSPNWRRGLEASLIRLAIWGLVGLVSASVLKVVSDGVVPLLSRLFGSWLFGLSAITQCLLILVGLLSVPLLLVAIPGVRRLRDWNSLAAGFLALGCATGGLYVMQMVGADKAKAERLVVRGERLYWCGGMTKMAHARIAAMKHSNSGITTLVLMRNSGGFMKAAYDVADGLSVLGIDRVEAVGFCNSACAVLWMAAPRRALAVHTTLGFHAPHDTVSKVVSPEEQSYAAGVLVGAGVGDAYARKLMEYADWDMGFITADSPELSGVDFIVVDRNALDESACAK
jgi:hypothetical protein